MTRKARVLLIDDTRTEDELRRRVDVIARNYWEGSLQLTENGPWDLLLLDHDLKSFNEDGKEFTGYNIACMLERLPEYLPKEVICVSSNPTGKQRIEAAIESARRKESEGE